MIRMRMGSIGSSSSRNRKGQKERTALALTGFSPHTTAVLFHHQFHNGQPHSGAFVLFWSMQPFKESEDFDRLFPIKADAVVTDRYDTFPVSLAAADRDLRMWLLP